MAGVMRGRCRSVPSVPTLGSTCTRSNMYTLQELGDVLKKLQVSKRSIKLPYTAVKENSSQGKALTLALMNCSRHVGLTSTHWSLRQFAPIRRSGLSTVRAMDHLRPVSLCSDMAQVSDDLWVKRNSGILEKFFGADQVGCI